MKNTHNTVEFLGFFEKRHGVSSFKNIPFYVKKDFESPFELYWSSKDKDVPSESHNDLNNNLDRKIIDLSFNPCDSLKTHKTLTRKLDTLWMDGIIIIPKIENYYYKIC